MKTECRKRVFTLEAARRALATSLLSGMRKRKEKRYYYCEQCQGYHLTSRTEFPESVKLPNDP